MTLPLLLGLMGCYEPLSNAVFEEDQAYLAGFPERSWMGPPERFLTGELSGVPQLAREAAADLRWRTTPALEAGLLLREATPDRRGPSSRTWDSHGLTTAGQAWWIRAEAVLEDDEAVSWTVEAATASDGDFTVVGEGSWEPSDGLGFTSWDLEITAALLEVEGVSGTLEVSWEEDEAGIVSAQLTHLDAGQALLGDPVWELWDEPTGTYDGLAFIDRLEVTSDGEARTGWAMVVESNTDGRAEGAVLGEDDRELAFALCWNEVGEVLWQDGDTGIERIGEDEDCGIPPF